MNKMAKEDTIDNMDLTQLKEVVKNMYKFLQDWINPDKLNMDLYSNQQRADIKDKLNKDFDKIIK